MSRRAWRWIPLLCLGIATLYKDDYSQSAQWWQRLAADEEIPAAHRSDGYTSLALLACFGQDVATAQEQAQRGQLAAAASGSGAYRAFASYTAGETALLEDPEVAVGLLRAAVAEAAAAGATQVVTVARIALVPALTRLARHEEALALFPQLLEQARRDGSWPQLWTALRILAELLAELGQPETAALLLAAARHAPTAPAVTGADVPRYRELELRLAQQTAPGAMNHLDALARALPRAHVLDRALTAVAESATEEATAE